MRDRNLAEVDGGEAKARGHCIHELHLPQSVRVRGREGERERGREGESVCDRESE